ncbi:MAG: flavodoxin family protein [Methanosphaera sp.]|nr:flavodoxin family protein [Methanosphaera sp.]
MTYYIVNGSPRNNFNTKQLLEKSIEGIKSIKKDAEIEEIDLYQLNYTGCRGCFSCKVKNGPFYSKCPINDDLKELLEKMWDSEGIILGSPVYFGNLSGQMRSFIERLLFPKFRYGEGKIMTKDLPIGLIVSMNLNPENGGLLYDETIFNPINDFIEKCFSKPEILKVYDTYQFVNYDLYENEIFTEEHKRKVKEEQFPKDLDDAFNLGVTIAGR